MAMNFQDALYAMQVQDGRRVRRAEWPESMTIFIEEGKLMFDDGDGAPGLWAPQDGLIDLSAKDWVHPDD